MNKRQAKKAFKKKYGMNPAQYKKWMDSKLPKTYAEGIQAAAEAICNAFRIFADAAVRASERMNEGMLRWAEEVRREAEVEDLLKKSQLMPEGAEIELLKHIGIRMDRYRGAYDFYYDEANDAYFVVILQKGGER